MRKDTDIQLDIENELKWDPSLDAKDILVKVVDGVVTLGGQVPHYADHWMAATITKRVAGVRAIANDIEVRMPKAGERSDADIANAAANALKWHFSVGTSNIKPIVDHGRLTLSGEVEYAYQRIIAESAVRYLSGVKGLVNDIVIRPTVKATDIKEKIEAAFQRQANLDAKQIVVNVSDAQVTLKGFVHSWREKDDADRAAWAAPGITKVDNQLKVMY
jgi:osmotically-inducible protein OsmY